MTSTSPTIFDKHAILDRYSVGGSGLRLNTIRHTQDMFPLSKLNGSIEYGPRSPITISVQPNPSQLHVATCGALRTFLAALDNETLTEGAFQTVASPRMRFKCDWCGAWMTSRLPTGSYQTHIYDRSSPFPPLPPLWAHHEPR